MVFSPDDDKLQKEKYRHERRYALEKINDHLAPAHGSGIAFEIRSALQVKIYSFNTGIYLKFFIYILNMFTNRSCTDVQ